MNIPHRMTSFSMVNPQNQANFLMFQDRVKVLNPVIIQQYSNGC